MVASLFQELISFPPIVSLPQHIREALMVQAPDHHQLPESTPNPSLTFMADDFASMAYMPPPPKSSQNGSSNLNGGQKMRIPMERRYVVLALSLALRRFPFRVTYLAQEDTMPTLPALCGPRKCATTTVDSQRL